MGVEDYYMMVDARTDWRVGVALDAYQMADAMLVARNIER